MDSDAAFVADADLDNQAHAVNERKRRSSSTGENDAIAAKGGIEAHRHLHNDEEADEDSPLLEPEEPSGQQPRWTGLDDFDGLPWYKRPSIFWLIGPFFLMTIAFGGIITPKINLILNLICREYISDRQMTDPSFTMTPVDFSGGHNAQCRIPEVQSRVAQFTLYGSLIAGVLSAFTSPKLGELSDRFGRKPILITASVGTMCAEIITIFAAKYPEDFPVNWMLLGYALDGLTGSFIVAMAIANAYATDCTPPPMRGVAFSYLHGCLFTGIAIGPILAGYFVKWSGSIVTIFYICLGVHLFFALFVLLVVPESLSKRRQNASRDKHRIMKSEAGPAGDWINQMRSINLLEPLKILYPTGDGSSRALRWNLIFLSAVDTTVFGVAMGSMTVVVIYTNYQFGWEAFESARFMSIVNSARVICLIILLPLVTRLVRGKSSQSKQKHKGSDNFDLYTVRFAVFFDTIGYLGYTLARTGPLMTLAGAVAAVGGVASPTLQAALTKHVPEDRTGQLLGANGLLHALARVVAPTVFGAIYSATVGKFTQTVFVCLTATFGIAFVLSWFVKPHVYFDEPPEAEEYPTRYQGSQRATRTAGLWSGFLNFFTR